MADLLAVLWTLRWHLAFVAGVLLILCRAERPKSRSHR